MRNDDSRGRVRWTHAPSPLRTVGVGAAVTAIDVGSVAGRATAVVGHHGGPTLVDVDSGVARTAAVACDVTSLRCVGDDAGPEALLGCEDGALRVLDLVRGTVSDPIPDHVGRVTGIVTVDGEPSFVTAGPAGALHLWASRDGRWATTRNEGVHDLAVRSLAAGRIPEGAVVVSGGGDGILRFWDGAGLAERSAPIVAGSAAISALLVVERHGRPAVVAGSLDGSIVVHDLADGTRISGPHHVNAGGIASLALVEAQGRRVLLCGLAGTNWRGPRAWDLDGDRLLPGAVPREADTDTALAVTRQGDAPLLVRGGWRATVTMSAVDVGRLDAPPLGHMKSVNGVDIARADGRDLVVSSGEDGTLRTAALADGEEVAVTELGDDALGGLACLGPAERPLLAVALPEGDVDVRRLSSSGPSAPVASFRVARRRVDAVANSVVDGRGVLVAAVPDAGVRVVDQDGRTVRELPDARLAWPPAVAVGTDGRIVTAGDQEVRVSSPDGRSEGRWRELLRVFAVAVLDVERRTMDRRWEVVAVAGEERIVRLRDPSGVEILPPLVGHTDIVGALAAPPGRSLLLSAADDHTVRLWDVARSRQLASVDLGWMPSTLVPRMDGGRLVVAVAGAHLGVLEFDLPRA